MSLTIDILAALVISFAVLFLISAYQEISDRRKEVSEYESRIKELQELLEEQNRRREAEFNCIVASGEENPEQRAYFVARAMNAIHKK